MNGRKLICSSCGAEFSTMIWKLDKLRIGCCPGCKREFAMSQFKWIGE